MTKSGKQETFPNPMTMFESLMPKGMNANPFEAFGQAGNAWMQGMAGFHGELSAFFNTRLQQDVQFTQALAQCKDWQQAVALQQSWMRETAEEYTRAAEKLSGMSTQMMTDGWSQKGATGQPEKKA